MSIYTELQEISRTRRDIRKFSITIALVLVVITAFLFWKDKENFLLSISSLLAIIFFLVTFAFLAPQLIKPIYLLWMSLAILLGWVMTRLILSLLFYLVLTPVGLLGRVVRKQFLNLTLDKNKNSYWCRYTSKVVKESYEKQF